jgi:uncharacterized protein (DUF2225 family)
MVSQTLFIFLGIVVIFLVVLLLSIFWGKGQPIKCPECGFKFKRPLVQKTVGAGPAPRWLGSYTCPQCKYHGPTSKFVRAADLNNDEK